MSHGDRVECIPQALTAIRAQRTIRRTRPWHADGLMRGIQFHPGVAHTPQVCRCLRNLVLNICGEPGDWTMAGFVETKLKEIATAPAFARSRHSAAPLPGGVDPSVAAALIHSNT